MKIIQSFWSQNPKDILNSNFGWLSSKYSWLSWVLSSNQLAKFYNNVELYTDKLGYKILIEKLKLPYSKVHVCLDKMDKYDPDLWAISKIETYARQSQPFLHIDGDVFIWDKFEEELINSNLITQNVEHTTAYYEDMWKDIEPNLTFIPEEMRPYSEGRSNFAYNMGIVGGADIEFFKKYTAVAKGFVNKNRNSWDKINGFNFNVFFEQVLFYLMSNDGGKEVACLFNEIPDDNNYIGFGDFDKVPQKKYLHLLGGYKRNEKICKSLECFVLKEYPEFVERLKNIWPEEFLYYDGVYDSNRIEQLKQGYISNALKPGNSKITTEYIIGRDIVALESPQLFDRFISEGIDFKLILLPEAEVHYEENAPYSAIKIHEINNKFSLLPLDTLDIIILENLINETNYSSFIKIMFDQLETSEKGLRNEFGEMLTNRIHHFIYEKIVIIRDI